MGVDAPNRVGLVERRHPQSVCGRLWDHHREQGSERPTLGERDARRPRPSAHGRSHSIRRDQAHSKRARSAARAADQSLIFRLRVRVEGPVCAKRQANRARAEVCDARRSNIAKRSDVPRAARVRAQPIGERRPIVEAIVAEPTSERLRVRRSKHRRVEPRHTRGRDDLNRVRQQRVSRPSDAARAAIRRTDGRCVQVRELFKHTIVRLVHLRLRRRRNDEPERTAPRRNSRDERSAPSAWSDPTRSALLRRR